MYSPEIHTTTVTIVVTAYYNHCIKLHQLYSIAYVEMS